MKKEIREKLIDSLELCGDVREVAKYLTSLYDKFPDWLLEIENEYYYDSFQHNLIGVRVETDEEYSLRLEAEKEWIRVKNERKAQRLAKQQEKASNRIQELEDELAKLKANS
jgi:hypothetical protein